MVCPNNPGAPTGTLGCGTHQVEIWNHDQTGDSPLETNGVPVATFTGSQILASPHPFHQIKWDRRRDDISQAELTLATDLCCVEIAKLECIRQTMVIRRSKDDFATSDVVWVGIITRIEWGNDVTLVVAHDMLWAAYRTILFEGYNNKYDKKHPEYQRSYAGGQMFHDLVTHCYERAGWPRFDWWGMKGRVHWVTRCDVITSDNAVSIRDAEQPKTSRVIPYGSTTVWEDVDALAQYSDMDYTTVGKDIYLWHNQHKWCVIPGADKPGRLSLDWLSGVPDIVEYGFDIAIRVARTNGTGIVGDSNFLVPDFYRWGPIEMLDSDAQDESDVVVPDDFDPNNLDAGQTAVRDKFEQTARARKRIARIRHLRVRMPSGVQVMPNAPFEINDLVAGAWIWLDTQVTNESGQPILCKSIRDEWQRIEVVEVVENQEEGEIITFDTETAPPEVTTTC